MALWQIMNNDGTATLWDDGLSFQPGEDGFDTTLVKAKAKTKEYNYVGTPNWTAQEEVVVDSGQTNSE